MRLIETSHLDNWADSIPAKSRFPYLVKELILASIEPKKLRMPSGDAVWVPGYDGVLVNGEENRFVPKDLSVWELGTNKNFKDKADNDYEKRSKDKTKGGKEGEAAQRLERSQLTFVFATPRVWANSEEWVTNRRAEGIWKDVVVIDGVVLQDWLETTPAISLRLAAELGIVFEPGLHTPEQAWEEWSYRTAPPTSEELVVAGREMQEKELIERLLAPPDTFIVRGDSPSEAWGFALAVMRRLTSGEERLSLYARTVIADNEDIAGRLQHVKNLIIILKQTHGQVSGLLSSRGSHVIVPEGNDAHSERNVIVLSRPSHYQFAEALGRMGISDDEAHRTTHACGRSVTILQRQMAQANYERPQWVNRPTVGNLLPALLAGRWDDRRESDREILCHLFDTPEYSQVVSQLQEFLWVDEPPLQKIGEMWTLTAPVDTFQLIARFLTVTNMERFKGAFRDVFGRIDPRVEIPPDEWLYHDIEGERRHSRWLRSGMAETLLLIAERGTDARLICVPSAQIYAEELVRGLPGLNDDWRLLASLRDEYRRLVEAAPNPFLDSLERLLEARPGDVRQLFAEGSDIFGGEDMHIGLLWGLETLAWSPDYLPRVALILAKLTSLDPGVRIHNRPINSLREIFLWWHPGTNAPLEQRIDAIDLILDREPETGWALLAKLLPDPRATVSHPTAKPRWRDFGDLPEDARTRHGQLRYLSIIIDRAIDHIGTDSERWRAILDSLQMFSPTQQEKVTELLDNIASESASEDVKNALWETLRDFTYHHQSFQGAKWTLSKELVDRLEAVLTRLAPGDPVERGRWLFDDWWPELPTGERDIEQRELEVKQLREQVVREILQTEGNEGIVKLGTTCKYPGFVASAIVSLLDNTETLRRFIDLAVSAGEAGVFLAGQVSGRAQQVHLETWRSLILKEANIGDWSPIVIASLLMWWPDEKTTWEDAAALGKEVAAEYWRRKQVFLIKGSPEDQTYQINRLIEVGRAAEAFDRISGHGRGVPTEALLRLFDATIGELAKAQTVEEIRRFGVDSNDVKEFLGELRKRGDLPRDELARREYQALPLLGWLNISGLTIHEFMAEEPEFFVDVICSVFLPAHRNKDEDAEPTPEARARADSGYRLLEGMDRIPGQREGNQIDEEALLQWINAVREKGAEFDRATITDQTIGGILAHAPNDPEDDGWPHQSIRNIIEKLADDNIDRGLEIKRYNMRGTFSKNLYEGGAQERIFANQYRSWALISRARWPRMAQVLDAIAQSWERDACREDERAEQDKLDR